MADAATQKLYLKDSYAVSFDASLLSCEPRVEGGFQAVLDRSCFYPESGGQLADRGRIAGVSVAAVREDDAGCVYHQVESKIPPGPVGCTVDWETRFDHMQQHTGQHVLSRSFIEIADMPTISFHMGEESCTIDVDGGSPDDRIVVAAERLANSIIWENREVKVKTLSPDQVKEPLLRKSLPEGVDEIRLVEVDGFDVIGCCGTHVRRTGELGLIKVLKYEKAKGANRVHFKVGKRALADYATRHEVVKLLANRFTTSTDSLVEKIEKLHTENQRHRKEVQKLTRKLVTFEARAIIEESEMHHGCKLVAEVLKDASEDHLRLLSSELKKKESTVSIVASEEGLVLCNSAADIEIDFAKSVIERAKDVGGSGGGKGGFATVRLPPGVAVAGFVGEAIGAVRDKVRKRG